MEYCTDTTTGKYYEQVEVLILILLEYCTDVFIGGPAAALRGLSQSLFFWNTALIANQGVYRDLQGVLILILLEYCTDKTMNTTTRPRILVLILILLEYCTDKSLIRLASPITGVLILILLEYCTDSAFPLSVLH